MTDQALVLKVLHNDHSAYNMLMERYYGALFAFASRILRNDPISEDVVQDVFVNIWENRKKLARVSSFRSYAYTMVRNSCVDITRTNERLRKYLSDKPVSEDELMNNFLAMEVARQLHNAIETLPVRTQRVIKLSLEGLSQESIAEDMNITLPTVKSLKAEGIKKLRKILGPMIVLLFFN